ncbi:AI-2E family transporter [Mangrovivirga sp. M17]|uniref:AI-2E family transporter n=1 Tax=Mangrovivirga halotolerans TaxID=2993936 RepID=A0ABT3RU89_9BACT|nr:AI-2E family transporter [Mangrovivirga halotolerans]MCX2745346.1 AI-2E family transporter [Mangrovivirga halotolerans]
MKDQSLNKATVLILTLGISLLFLIMVKGFLMAIFLAAIFAGMLYPFYKRLTAKLGGRQSASAAITLVLFVLIILLPFAALMVVVIEQAVSAVQLAGPWLSKYAEQPGVIVTELEKIPIVHKVFPDNEKLAGTVGNVVKGLGNFIIDGLQSFSSGTANFIFSFFIFLFTFYYFLINGKSYLEQFLYYLPLKNDEEKTLLTKFVKVTKATLKGTLLIGVIQGVLGGIGMAIAGIPNVIFWSVVMVIFSIIPALGTAIVWVPAVIYLFIIGDTTPAIILGIYCVVVVGNIDNLIRPKLVGKDAGLPDLMILFGTLGGLAIFGIAGIIIGPLVAALFLAFWEIYGHVFQHSLYPVNDKQLEEDLKGGEAADEYKKIIEDD